MRILFLFNMLLCFVVNASAQKSIGEIFEPKDYANSNKELTIVKYKGPDGNVFNYGIVAGMDEAIVLPLKSKVRKFSDGFRYFGRYNEDGYKYKEISIPEQIVYQGKSYKVTAIFDGVFDVNCQKLTLPRSIKEFGLFSGVDYCQEVHISDLDAFFSASNFKVPAKLYLKGNMVTDFVLPKTCKMICQKAFANCDLLKSIVIPDGVTIDNSAFINCRNLTSLTILGRTTIGIGAFEGCGLTSITIPKGVTSIADYAFAGCKSLKSVIIDNPRIVIGNYAFGNCPNLYHIQGLTEYTKVTKDAFEDSPFDFENHKKSFTFYATYRLRAAIEEWQKKGEFETTAQWQQRVTKNTRDAKVAEITKKVKQEFIEKGKSVEPVAEIQEYDADKSVFTVKIGQEEVYIKVPNDEARQFKANFKPEGMQAKYDIANDRLNVVERSYQYAGKTYPTTNTYSKADNLDYLALNLPPLEMDFSNSVSTTTKPNVPTDLTIDKNIPTTNIKNDHTFAVIIGNENYKSVSKVQYAQNDARSFAEYCKKTLGLPEKNVRGYEDATYGMMVSALQDIKKIASAYHGDINVIFYYAGHGIPDNSSKNAYLLPIDADGRQMDICLSLNKLYQDLGALEAKSVTVFLDACFSGALRGDGMLMAARGVAIKPKTSAPQGKMVIFSAATDEQTAFPYTEKGHGMFTYYLLKKIRDTNGDCTLGELGSYICNEVAKQSIVTNGREQTPSVSTSTSIVDSWKNLKLK